MSTIKLFALLSISAISCLSYSPHIRFHPTSKLNQNLSSIQAISNWKQDSTLQRKLSDGEFDDLNQLFDGMVIGLPDTKTREDLGGIFGSVLFEIKNLQCFKLSIEDVLVSHVVRGITQVLYNVEINGANIDCTFDWTHDYALGGSGNGSIKTRNNTMKSRVNVLSDDFRAFPPKKAFVDSCTATINIVDMDFSGGVSGFLADTFAFTFTGDVEKSIKETICNEMESVTFGINFFLTKISSVVESYFFEIPWGYNDPISGQSLLSLSNGISYFDLTDTSNPVGNRFIEALLNFSVSLGTKIIDDNNPGFPDLGINIYFRDNILDSNRMLHRTPSQLGIEPDGTLFTGRDALTETTVKLLNFFVIGIDSVSRFDTFDILSPQTIQTNVRWDMLEFKVRVMIDSRPSAAEDSIIIESNFPRVIEYATITFRIVDLIVQFSFLTAMDENKLFNIPFGAYLEERQFFRCILSSNHDIKVTQVAFISGKYEEPSIQGFIDEGLDRIVSDTAVALHTMYKRAIIKAMPTYFGTTMKAQLEEFLAGFMNDVSNIKCPTYDDKDTTPIDFRDLFLDPQKAKELGASGTSPYGNKSFEIKSQLDNQLTQQDAINDMLIRPATLKQSKEEGTFVFPGSLFDFSSNGITLKISDARIENVNSFGIPDELLSPQREPFTLHNAFAVGNYVPLLGLANMEIFNSNDGVITKNNLQISMGMNDVDIMMKTFTTMEKSKVLQFPVKDIYNIRCWLATLPPPILDEFGFRRSNSTSPITITDFTFTFVKRMSLNIDCISCTSAGVIELPNIIKILKSVGVVRDMMERLLFFVEEIVNSEYTQIHLDRYVGEASTLCPHDPLFGSQYDTKSFIEPPIYTEISEESLEFSILSASISAQAAFIMIAVNSEESEGVMDPLSGEKALEALDIDLSMILNLTSYEKEISIIINNSLQNLVDDPRVSSGKDMNINSLIRSNILFDKKSFYIEPDAISIPIALGSEMHLKSIQLFGLDSFSSVDAYNVISPHTVRSDFVLEEIFVELDFSLEELNNPISITDKKENLVARIGLEKVKISSTIMLALEKESTLDIQLGSLLDTSAALQCILSNSIAANVTELLIEPSRMSSTKVKGLLSTEGRRIFSTSVDSIFSAYMSNITSMLETYTRIEMNNALEEFIIQSKIVKCSKMNLKGGFIDLRDLLLNPENAKNTGGAGNSPYGDLFYILKDRIDNNYVSPNENGYPKINDVFFSPDILEYTTSEGLIYIPGDELVMDVDEKTKVQITNVMIANMDSVGYPFQALQPSKEHPNIVNNAISMGVNGKVFQFQSKIIVNIHEDEIDEKNIVQAEVKLDNVSILVSVLAKIDEKSLKELTLRNVNNPDCWMATIPPPTPNDLTLYVDSFDISYSHIEVIADCESCQSSEVESVTTLTKVLRNPDAFAKFLSNFVTGPVLQERIIAMQHESTIKCQISYENTNTLQMDSTIKQSKYIDDTYKPAATLFLLGVIFFAIVSLTSILIKYFSLQKHKEWLSSLTEEEIFSLYQNQLDADSHAKNISDSAKSMGASTPFAIQILIFILLVISIALFITAHFFSIGFVDMRGHFSSERVNIPELYNFSVFSFIMDTWRAGSKVFSGALFFFTIFIPYLKPLLLTLLWYTPPRILSISNRGYLLYLVQSFDKWSTFHLFILTIFISSLKISISSPIELPVDFYSIDIEVITMRIFSLSAVAQILTHVCSHLSIYYHEKIISQSVMHGDDIISIERMKSNAPIVATTGLEMNSKKDDLVPKSLCKHAFKLRGLNKGESMEAQRGVNCFVLLISFLSMLLLLMGFFLPSLKIEVFGLLGFIFEASIQFDETILNHSILSIVQLLLRDKWKYVYGVILIFSFVIIPYMLFVCLLYIWFVPMREKSRELLMKGIEILKSWSNLEVYIFALMVASWQIDGISGYILSQNDEYCSSLRKVFSSLVYYDVLNESNIDQCVHNKVSIGNAIISLILSSVLRMWLTHFVTKAASQKKKDDEIPPKLDNSQSTVVNKINKESLIKLIRLDPAIQFTDCYNLLLRRIQSEQSSFVSKQNITESSIREEKEFPSGDNLAWANSFDISLTTEGVEYQHDDYFL